MFPFFQENSKMKHVCKFSAKQTLIKDNEVKGCSCKCIIRIINTVIHTEIQHKHAKMYSNRWVNMTTFREGSTGVSSKDQNDKM